MPSTAPAPHARDTFSGHHSRRTMIPLSPAARTLRTLIIDDSAFDRKRLSRHLVETGLQFDITAIDGVKGLRDALDKNRFDLAMVDFRLTEEDGLEAVRRIRSHPDHVNAAIIMLTGRCEISVAINALKGGCADFIDKADLSPNALRRAVLNAVEKSDLLGDLMRARGVNDKLQALVQDFAHDTAAEMKPLVLRMMRTVRAKLASPTGKQDHSIEDLDQTCRKLWALMEAMERKPAPGLRIRSQAHHRDTDPQ